MHKLLYVEDKIFSISVSQGLSLLAMFIMVDFFRKIDIVILNAATFGLPWTVTEDGLETIFQVNFFSQYYLLMCLDKILSSDVRVVFTSSESHRCIIF